MKSSEPIKLQKPNVVENYRDFEPPTDVRSLVETLLDAVPQKYLIGLKTILLTNQEALTRDQRRQKTWSRNRKYPLAKARGAYYKATKDRPATVWLFVDNILRGQPSWFLHTPLFRYWEISEVLYHEIGHHIHEVHNPEYEGKENVAEEWSKKLSRHFYRRHYWYLVPILYLPGTLMNRVKRIKKKSKRASGSATA